MSQTQFVEYGDDEYWAYDVALAAAIVAPCSTSLQSEPTFGTQAV